MEKIWWQEASSSLPPPESTLCPLRVGWLALLCPQGDIPSTGKTDQAPLGAQCLGAGAKKAAAHCW